MSTALKTKNQICGPSACKSTLERLEIRQKTNQMIEKKELTVVLSLTTSAEYNDVNISVPEPTWQAKRINNN